MRQNGKCHTKEENGLLRRNGLAFVSFLSAFVERCCQLLLFGLNGMIIKPHLMKPGFIKLCLIRHVLLVLTGH